MHLQLTSVSEGHSRSFPAQIRNFSLEQAKMLVEVTVSGNPQLWRICFSSARFSINSRPPTYGQAETELVLEMLPGTSTYAFVELTNLRSL
jgi:hypothetical protein